MFAQKLAVCYRNMHEMNGSWTCETGFVNDDEAEKRERQIWVTHPFPTETVLFPYTNIGKIFLRFRVMRHNIPNVFIENKPVNSPNIQSHEQGQR
jgi:hypothetical protein